MNIKKHIPNAITSMNLLCGVIATVYAISGHLQTATLLIFAGALFDFCDGFAARALKVSSDIGKELDSLADIVSFGIAPAAMYSTYIKTQISGYSYSFIGDLQPIQLIWTLLPFILVVFAALRLAKFNLDTRQSEEFLGLTTTATGLFSASLMWMIVEHSDWFTPWFSKSIVMLMIFIFCVLLVSEVPMFSLKIKHFTWKDNQLRFILIAVALISICILGIGGIAATILAYILFSLIKYALNK